MTSAIADLHRIGLKIFIDDPLGVQPKDFVPIFHHWIQRDAVEDLLIDVADYQHLAKGPAVVLVGHEGNYSIDVRDGRMGLEYVRKQPVAAPLANRLRQCCRLVLTAAQLLEAEPALGGRVVFRGHEIQVFANDRLVAPNTQATLTAFRPVLTELLRSLYDEAVCDLRPEADPRERFLVTVRAPQPVRIQTLLERLRPRQLASG